MMSSGIPSHHWQQVLALDARYNAYRTPNNPGFRTQYIRRRSQLLRDSAKEWRDPVVWKQYLRLRSQLLAQRYGYVPSDGSIRSRSLSMRSNSQLTLDGGDLFEHSKKIVPTVDAEASRALVGNTSLGENYSFAGVHNVFEQHKAAISRLKWANDDHRRVAIASLDGTLSICTVSDRPNESSFTTVLKGHSKGITDFEWSSSNDLIVTCSLDGTVRVWNANSGECIRIIEENAPILCCCFQPLNNNLVVTGNNRCQVQVLNISTGMHVKMGSSKTNGAVLSMCSENSGKMLWVGDEKGNIFSFFMDLVSGKLIKSRRYVVSEGCAVSSLSVRAWVSREARDPVLLANTTANALFLFNVNSVDGSLAPRKRFKIIQSQHRSIRSNFCPLMSFREGACVVSGSEDCCVYLLDIERESDRTPIVNKLQGHSGAVIDVAFNHDESFLASGDEKGMVIVWKREKKVSEGVR